MNDQFELTIDALAQRPLPGTKEVINPVFSPDSSVLFYLYADEGSELALHRYDIATQNDQVISFDHSPNDVLTLEEQLRRERSRFSWEGLSSFELSIESGASLALLNVGGAYVVIDIENSQMIADFSHESFAIAKFMPKGNAVIASTGHELILYDLATKERKLLASSDDSQTTVGLAEYIAQEELDRSDGFWASPCGSHVAFCEVDEAHVDTFLIVHQGSRQAPNEEHKYPFAGENNAKVRIGLACVDDGSSYFFDDFGDSQEYVAFVKWHDDRRLVIGTLNRVQSRLSWWVHNLDEKYTRQFFVEDGDPWINIPQSVIPQSGGSILTTSETTGFSQVVSLGFDGICQQISSGSFVIGEILSYDKDQETIYCVGSPESPLESHLLAISLHSGGVEKCTLEPGRHRVIMAPSSRMFLDQYSNRDTANIAKIRQFDSDLEFTLVDPTVTRASLGLVRPEIFSFGTNDELEIFGAIYLPPENLRDNAPIVISIYGGPHAQMVTESWSLTIDLTAQYLAASGVAVLKVDGRGSFGRGKKFEAWLYKKLGQVELQDQLSGVAYVASKWNLDSQRLGIYGWSYGGFMALNALINTKGVFRVGVAGAPVTDFRLYDTAYTERYMLLPSDNVAGYDETNLSSKVENLQGSLLLIHGMIDENVHFRNSGEFIEALYRANKEVEFMILPEQRHMPRGFSTLRAIAKRRIEFLINGLGLTLPGGEESAQD